jgi:tocopherol cyclase
MAKLFRRNYTFFILILLSVVPINQCLQAQQIQNESVFSQHKFLPGYGIKKLGHPEIFQGNKKNKNYFEGWYFKLVSADHSSILSIIPGIALSDDGKEQHAFIQTIDGTTAQTNYYSFPIEEFAFSKEKFAITIGQNYFSSDTVILDLRSDSSNIKGIISLTHSVKLESHRILNSGIMGWYRFVPFMECYHGVVSLSNQLNGSLIKDGKAYNFNNGIGYIEKDWGSSMPSAWIWMQSNHFNEDSCAFMLSVANVPWMGKSFTGFLGFFLFDNTVYRFATYTHAKIMLDESNPSKTKITIKDKKNTYLIEAYRNQTGLLKAPVNGSMDRRIPESIDAKILLTVLDNKKNVIFCDSSSFAGLELVGDQSMLSNQLSNNRR